MIERAYVGTLSCGCAVAAIAISANKETARWTAKEVGRWIRDGLQVETQNMEWVSVYLRACVHGVRAGVPAPAVQEPLKFEPVATPDPLLFGRDNTPPEALANVGRVVPCQHPGITPERVARLTPGHSLVCADCGHVARKVDDFQQLADGAEAILANRREPEPA